MIPVNDANESHALSVGSSEQYGVFIDAIIRAFDPVDAARLAGFKSPSAMAPMLLQQPAIRKALVAAAAARLEAGAMPAALNVIERLLTDPKTPHAVAAKLALGVLDRAGIGAKADAPTNPLKDMGDMTVEELEAYIAERGDKAKPVSVAPPQQAATSDDP